jgi:ankyrin repeat protein
MTFLFPEESPMSDRRRFSLVTAVVWSALGAAVTLGVQQLMKDPGLAAPRSAEATPSAAAAAIHEAVSRGDVAAVRTLIATAGTRPLDLDTVVRDEQSSRIGLAPIHIAAIDHTPELLKVLLDAKAKVETRDADGRTALVHAAGWGDVARVKLLLDAGARTDARASDGWTALMFAAARGDAASVRALVQAGADVNATNKWRQTPLMAASRSGAVDKISALLEAGANVAAVDLEGNTALSIATSAGAPAPILAALIKAGAPVDAADSDGVTPLMKAADRADTDQVRVLLAAGASPSVKDRVNNWTARDWAAKRDDDQAKAILELLSR